LILLLLLSNLDLPFLVLSKIHCLYSIMLS
jgi:hypothetical protein